MPTPCEEVAIKLTLVRSQGEEKRRFRGSFDYDGLVTCIAHLWGGCHKSIQLEYVDDEGDVVRLSSQSEWEECVRLHKDGGLKVALTARKRKDKKAQAKQVKGGDSAKPRCASAAASAAAPVNEVDDATSADEEERDEAAPVDVAPRSVGVPVLPPLPLPTQKQVQQQQQSEVAVEDATSALLKDLFETNDLLSDAAKLTKYITCVDQDDLVDLHLDVELVTTQTINTAVERMNKGNDASALRLLQLAVDALPAHPYIDFNAACAHSKLGHVEDAVASLRRAVQNGFTEFDHMMKDNDLESIRSSTPFAAFVDELKASGKIATTPVSAPAAPLVVVAPQAEQPATASTPSAVEQFLTLFPDADPPQVQALLLRYNGNLNLAINRYCGN